MPVILDPNKSFISIITYYVEEIKKHGNSIFKFIKDRDEFEKYKEKGYRIRSDIAKDGLKPKDPAAQALDKNTYDPSKVIQELTTWWKRLTWKEQNIIFSKSIRQSTTPEGKTINEIDNLRYRDLKLKTCLKKWDLKDDVNNPVKLDEETIDNMDPTFAVELLSSFELITEADEDDLKK